MTCPCGSLLTYMECCGQYIEQKALPPTPEALMRSRYTAFTLHNFAYIKATMKGKALAKFKVTHSKDDDNRVKWIGLTVLSTKMKTDRNGFVSFEARYEIDNQPLAIREKSEFRKFGEQWFYIDGKEIKRS
jgi:SEC-C motif-containing protein